jgi:Skp family chaperone for outer membrane proteins
MLNLIVVFIVVIFTPLLSFSVEIPLDKHPEAVTNTTQQGSANIGYVDIDKVFAEHPMTKRLKDEFCITADKKKSELRSIQMEIGRLEQIIVSSTTIVNRSKEEILILKNAGSKIAPPVVQSTSTSRQVIQSTASAKPLSLQEMAEKERSIPEMEKGIEELRKKIEAKKLEVPKMLESEKECLTKLEEDQTNSVLADIYSVLEKVAEEEDVTIIIDKNQLLYGKSVRDLTEKVLDRLRGR